MDNLIFLGITGLFGVFIMIVGIWYGAIDHKGWYIAPAICGLFAALTILGVIAMGTGRVGTVGWVSATAFDVLGLVLLWLGFRRKWARQA